MLTRIQDPHWSRVVYVAGGLGGLVTTAIGWVFEREVHRGTAEVASAAAHSARGAADAARDEATRARSEASQAHLSASQNERDAARGRALAVAIQAGPAARELTNDTEQLASVIQSHLSTLESMANALFADAAANDSSVSEWGDCRNDYARTSSESSREHVGLDAARCRHRNKRRGSYR
jgi:hypothetical protein